MPYRNNTSEHTSTINKTILYGYLLLEGFAYNNGYLKTIKNTPFFANYGTHLEYEMIGRLIQGRETKPEEMTSLHQS